MFASVYYEIAATLAIAGVFGAIGTALRQPLIISYIAAGIFVGPAVLGWVTATSQIELFASIGIAILLFVVGLKLDIGLISSVGPVALATGLGQVAFTSGVGFVIALMLGYGTTAAIYIAVALTFSSTIIIVKLLSDKREIDSLHGRIAVGFLIVQDIVVVIVMIVLSAFGGDDGVALPSVLLRVLLTGAAFVALIMVLMRFVIPRVLERVARSPELLVMTAIAWAISLAALGDGLGFSKEVGAFLAGFSLASTKFREAIASRLTSVRDFLLLFFFIDLGSKLDVTTIGDQIVPALVLSVFVLVGNPLIVVGIMGFMGYRRRTGFLAGLTVAQISEFSLILAALGVSLGHIGSETLGLITVVGIITIALSTYLILYSHSIYDRFERPLRFFERQRPFREIAAEEGDIGPARVDAIVFGLGRFGSRVADGLLGRGLHVLGVDFDPAAIREARSRGVPTQYGDADDPELTGTLPLGQARWIVSTTPVMDVNLSLLHALRVHGYQGKVALTAHSDAEAEKLKASGADLVLLPFVDAADQAVDLLTGQAFPIDVRTPEDIGITVERLIVEDCSPGVGARLLDLGGPSKPLVVMLKRGERVFVPTGRTIIDAKDELFALGSDESLAELRALLACPVERADG
ncbi:MAG: cation:proton antiporter [Clostridiales bacterium]|nr:cation:proton antiporter [Clostridiales bacterium]